MINVITVMGGKESGNRRVRVRGIEKRVKEREWGRGGMVILNNSAGISRKMYGEGQSVGRFSRGLLILLSFYSSVLGIQSDNPSASITTFPVMVYNWTSSHCPKYPFIPSPSCLPDILHYCDPDVVDACPRAWFDQTISSYRVLGSVNGVSRPQIGQTLSTIAHTCEPYSNATYDKDLALFRSNEWIEAPYVVSPQSVFALAHVDSIDENGKYLYTSVTLFSSTDGGATFNPSRPPPNHLVATTPFDNSNISLGTGVGFGMPSSIFFDNSTKIFYTILLSSWGKTVLSQQGGLCLLRTDDVTNPSSWLAWNGTQFSVSLNVSPLLAPVPNPDAHTCVPLLDSNGSPLGMRHLSLVRSTYFDSFLLFGEEGESSVLNNSQGWAFSLSKDLITWSVPVRVNASGFVNASGNSTFSQITPLPGRFIKTVDQHTFWVEPLGRYKTSLSTCTPCPGILACDLAVVVPPSTFYSIPNATMPFSCSFVYNVNGYMAYDYSVLVDATRQENEGDDKRCEQDCPDLMCLLDGLVYL